MTDPDATTGALLVAAMGALMFVLGMGYVAVAVWRAMKKERTK
jgi:hypothetical protein